MSIDTRQNTGIRPGRSTSAPLRGTGRTSTSHATTSLIRAGVVETPAREELTLERVNPRLLRILKQGAVIGYVEHVGRVYVALSGEHYDRAVEVAQTLDVARAARALA